MEQPTKPLLPLDSCRSIDGDSMGVINGVRVLVDFVPGDNE